MCRANSHIKDTPNNTRAGDQNDSIVPKLGCSDLNAGAELEPSNTEDGESNTKM
jgi:hypothetical protein